MNVRLPPELTGKAKKVMNEEINKQIVKNSKEYDADFEAMILWTLHKYFGFGKERLLRFRKNFIEEAKELRDFYMMDECVYPAKCKLELLGINIDELTAQDEAEEREQK